MRWQILFVFYKRFYWMTIGVSLLTCFLFVQSGDPKAIVLFLWTKLITNGVALLFLHLFDRDKLYFFYNLGYSARRLSVLSFVFDLLLWSLLLSLTLIIHENS
ncbi:MAG: hypothetical protein DI538_04530 [Azospira oryzae]|nr:MAG: hypothetical protein DI538_04530 [Azospira oryzae]